MNTYILMWILSASISVPVTSASAEFRTLDACETARAQIETVDRVKAYCFESGARAETSGQHSSASKGAALVLNRK